MVNEFNKIVGDMLAAEGAVHLPDVGTLVVVRRPAERISSRRLRRSCNAVLFTEKVRGRSVVDAVAELCGTDEAAARDIYRRWLSKCTDEGVLAIDGVGHIDRKRFFVDDAFDRLLNPNGHQVVELRRHGGRKALRISLWSILGLAVAGCVGYCVYECREDIAGTVADWFAPKAGAATVEQQSELRELPEQMPVEELAVVDEPVAEEYDAGMQTASEPEPQTTEPEPEQKPEPEPEEPQQRQLTPAVPSDGVGRLTSGWSYVVYGVFSTPENAMRAVTEVRAAGRTSCSAFVYGSKYMVALYFSADAAECTAYIRSAKEYESLWVYTAH